ncbi:MAG: bifunctional riboflavin kinase/FAD synthetase [Clostridia bacterium]|nr:bifunctional riboflavin kinase/FAD synthetase [Clostridia bacterium]
MSPCDAFSVDAFKSGTGIGLGNFDGVHLGHAALLSLLQKNCEERGLVSVVYTFSNHPNKVLFKDRKTPLIMTSNQKAEIFEAKNIDIAFFEHFDKSYADMTAENFIKEYLVKRFNAKLVVVGYNYSFGRKGAGDADLLRRYGEKFGFDVIVVPPVMHGEKVISSTLLRSIIAEGKLNVYKDFTGRYYSIPGTVAVGRRVGHALGFPTANILPKDGFALPASGVYATKTLIDGIFYDSATNIGNNPTFENIKDITVETHLFDYNSELYGKNIEVFFVGMIRSERGFENVELLKKQISIDIDTAKRMLLGVTIDGEV